MHKIISLFYFMNHKRYQRHYSVIGLSGQKKLLDSRICIIGSGGVGSPVALYLAAAGVGKLTLVDDDTVELSNLQRQILFTENDIGQSKAEQSRKHLNTLNREVKIKAINKHIKYDDALHIFNECDLIIDGSDNYATRYMVNDVCCQLRKPLISASVLREQAQIAFFDCQTYCYRCVYSQLPPVGLSPSCAEAGVIGAVAGVAGSVAANMAINFVVGYKMPKKMMLYNARDISWSEFEVNAEAHCAGCQQQQYIDMGMGNGCVEVEEINQISIDDFVLDVREPWEIEINPITSSFHEVRLNALLTGSYDVSTLPKNKRIVCICKHSARSKKAAAYLRQHGYDNVCSYQGGVACYLTRKLQVLKY